MHNGLYGFQSGLTTDIGHWQIDLPMLPKALTALGYNTAAIGKVHVWEAVPKREDLVRKP